MCTLERHGVNSQVTYLDHTGTLLLQMGDLASETFLFHKAFIFHL